MKMTFVGPVYPYRGGIAHYTAMLARSAQQLGHAVQVVSFRRQYPAWLYPGSSDKDNSAEPLSVPAEYLLDPLYPWTWWHSARVIEQFAPDLVAIHWWTTFWGPAFAGLAGRLGKRGIRVQFLIHNVIPHEAKPWDRWLARLALGRGQSFIVQTTHEQTRLKALIPTVQAAICPHPIYPGFGAQITDKGEARRTLHLPEGAPILLFFGIVRPYKGLRHLIEALAQVKESGQPFFLIVAGEFWEDQGLYDKRINELGLSGQIRVDARYIPNEEAHLYFSAADVMVAPYVGGTQSGAASLAAGYGLPIIASERVAAGISAVDGATIEVIPAGDTNALAQAIGRLLNSLPPRSFQASDKKSGWERLCRLLEETAEQQTKLRRDEVAR